MLICRCEEVTEEEIRRAIKEGADTITGVKRRTRAGMGGQISMSARSADTPSRARRLTNARSADRRGRRSPGCNELFLPQRARRNTLCPQKRRLKAGDIASWKLDSLVEDGVISGDRGINHQEGTEGRE